MLSIAEIPICGFSFTGVIGIVLLRGKEYRLATYLGAKAVKIPIHQKNKLSRFSLPFTLSD